MKRHLFSKLTCLALLSASSLMATAASVKSIGMGGACVAYPLDSGVMAFNPAGIVDLEDRVDIGAFVTYTDGSTTSSDNANPAVNKKDVNVQRWKITPDVGIVYHLNPCIAVGALLYNEKELNTRYKDSFPLVGTTNLRFEYVLEAFAPSVAVKFWDCMNFSATLNYFTQRIRLDGAQILGNKFAPLSEFPDNVTNRGYNYSSGYGVTFGWKGDLFPWLRAGVAWKPKTHMKTLNKYKGFIAEQGTLDIPMILRAGISVGPFCAITAAFDYQLVRYQKIPALNNDFQPNIEEHLFGEPQGAGFGWSDQHFFRMGLNWDINRCWQARVGFRHSNVTFKGVNVAPNVTTLDTTVDFITCGGTWRFLENMELNGLFVYGFNGEKKGPIPAGFGGGQTQVEQKLYLGGLSLSFLY